MNLNVDFGVAPKAERVDVGRANERPRAIHDDGLGVHHHPGPVTDFGTGVQHPPKCVLGGEADEKRSADARQNELHVDAAASGGGQRLGQRRSWHRVLVRDQHFRARGTDDRDQRLLGAVPSRPVGQHAHGHVAGNHRRRQRRRRDCVTAPRHGKRVPPQVVELRRRVEGGAAFNEHRRIAPRARADAVAKPHVGEAQATSDQARSILHEQFAMIAPRAEVSQRRSWRVVDAQPRR